MTRARTFVAFLLIVLFVAPVQGLPFGREDAPTGGTAGTPAGSVPLYLEAGTFDPVRDDAPGPAYLHAHSTHPYYVVQFDGPVRKAWREAVLVLGVELLEYLPYNGFFARLPVGRVADVAAADHVRYVGPAHPAYRLHGSLWEHVLDWRPVELELLTWPDDGAARLAERVARGGGLVLWAGGDHVTARLPVAAVAGLLRDAGLGIRWVEPRWSPTPINDNDARTANARQRVDGAYEVAGHAIWSYNPAEDSFEGYPGRNVTVTVADTGLDDSHPAFGGRVVHYFDYGNDGEADTNGHGTHCAGTVMGDGSWRVGDRGTEGKYAGVAPQALLVVQEVFNNPNPASAYGRDASNEGATISSNSWISGYFGNYNSICQAYDGLTRDANNVRLGDQPIFYVFGAGNDGYYGEGSIRPPSLAKNVLSVGSVGNDKWGHSSSTVSSFSSRGPTDDGRIKPDVLMPGQIIASTRSLDPGAHAGWSRPVDGGSSYVFATGTSMATPGAAGASAVVTQYLKDVHGEEPSPALLKALLINGARPLESYEYPGMVQGWGRIDLERSLLETESYHIYRIDQEETLSVEPGSDEVGYWFKVDEGTPLKVTLTWTDVAGTTNSEIDLINDLDLVLRSPSGKLYSGNDFALGQSRSNQSGNPDRTNNVEGFLLDRPEEGMWRVWVRAYNVPEGEQDFALVVSGDVVKGHVDLRLEELSADPPEVEEFHRVGITARFGNLGNLVGANVSYLLEREGPDGEVEVIERADLGDMAPGAMRTLRFDVTGARGQHVFRFAIDPDRRVIESNESNNAILLPVFFRGYDVVLMTGTTGVRGVPGTLVNFTVRLRNGGNVPDELSLELTEPPPGWLVSTLSFSYDLDPGDAVDFRVDVLIPHGELAERTVVIWLNGTSAGNASRTDGLRLEVIVDQVFGLEASPISGPQGMLPGEVMALEMLVRNTGNGPDVYTLAIPDLPPDGWWVLMPNVIVEVPSGSERNVTVHLTAPHEAFVGEGVSFDMNVTSSDPEVQRTVPFSAEIVQFYATYVTVLEDVDGGAVGDTVSIPLLIENRGNGPVEYSGDINFPDATWSGGLDIQGLRLVGYSMAYSNLTFRVPEGALNRSYEFTMIVLSTGGEVFYHNFTFEVHQFHDVTLAVEGAVPTVTQGDTLLISLSVTNGGNGPEAVLLTCDTPSTWTFEFLERVVDVEPFQRSEGELVLTTEGNTPGGTYDIRVFAYYGPARGLRVETLLQVTVMTRPDLELLSSGLNVTDTSPIEDSMVPVHVTVANRGETIAIEVFVQLYVDGVPIDQAQYVSSIEPGDEETLTFLWRASESGPHRLTAVADHLDEVDEANEGNNEVELIVTVMEPEKEASPGPGTLLAVLAFSVAVALGTRGRRP